MNPTGPRLRAAARAGHNRGMGRALLLVLLIALLGSPAAADQSPRFRVMGDGVIRLKSKKTGESFAGRYRSKAGKYSQEAWKRISEVLGAPFSLEEPQVTLRLIEALAFLQHALKTGVIEVSSGYRSPDYNRALRDKGGVVAEASLHQFGLAIDGHFLGVDPQALWRYARTHKVGGAGYYGNPFVHVDVGPVRFWTQTTANVRPGVPDHNRHAILVPEFDCYAPGETVRLRLARLTI